MCDHDHLFHVGVRNLNSGSLAFITSTHAQSISPVLFLFLRKGLELISLPQPSRWWDYKCMLPYLTPQTSYKLIKTLSYSSGEMAHKFRALVVLIT